MGVCVYVCMGVLVYGCMGVAHLSEAASRQGEDGEGVWVYGCVGVWV